MATHGSILIKNKEGKVFLNTTHDGHLDAALTMILDLPKLVAENSYLPQIYNVRDRSKPLTAKLMQELVNQMAGAGFEWTLLEIAAAIVSSHFNRWLIIPPQRIKNLVDYDQQPDLIVDFTDLDSVKITVKHELELSEFRDFWEFYWESHPALNKAVKNEKERTINHIPLFSEYIKHLVKLCKEADVKNE